MLHDSKPVKVKMSTKKQVLTLLEANRGQTISGTAIAQQLSLSRNAVWKAIKDLEKEGYEITASTNRGYCLSKSSDILSAQGMLPHLAETRNPEIIFVHDSLESTNKAAKELALSGAAHGTVVIADQQTLGKGRFGRAFHSPPHSGIYLSIVIDPKELSFSSQALVTIFTALSVCEAIEAISDKAPQIKWVNDVFSGGKKVCGISTEASVDFESGSTAWLVIGIGVNFTTPEEAFPQDSRNVVGSLFEENPPTNRNHLAAEIINRVLSPLERASEAEMLDQYKQRMFLLGKEVVVSRGAEQFEALAVDIDEAGQLIIKTDDEQLQTLSSGEISIRGK